MTAAFETTAAGANAARVSKDDYGVIQAISKMSKENATLIKGIAIGLQLQGKSGATVDRPAAGATVKAI